MKIIRKNLNIIRNYYDRRMRCMRLKLDDLVLACVKASSGDHKIADQWKKLHIKFSVN